MGEFFTDDIDSLLKSGHGDAARLSKIRANFEATKLVSIDDRKYVEGLLLRYSQPTEKKPEKSVDKPKRITPPPPTPISQPLIEVRPQIRQEQKVAKLQSKTKFRNIAIAVCITIAAVVAVSMFSMNQGMNFSGISLTKNLEVDSTSYVNGDIVSISGKTKSATQTVNLTISNPAGVEVFSDSITVKPNGSFSTLIIAGGQGWEEYGKYTITVNYSRVTETTSFNFIQG